MFVLVQVLRQWLDEKHQHKLQLVTTTTCASGMFAPVALLIPVQYKCKYNYSLTVRPTQ